MIHNSVFCFLFSSSRQTTSKLWSYRDYKQVARKLPLWGFVKQSNNVLLTVEGREKKEEESEKEKSANILGLSMYIQSKPSCFGATTTVHKGGKI